MTNSTQDLNRQMARRTGPCVVCQTPTNTSIMITGSTDWKAARLVHLGVPEQEAETLVNYAFEEQILAEVGDQPIVVTEDIVLVWPTIDDTITVRVCQTCASEAGWTAGTGGRPRTHVMDTDKFWKSVRERREHEVAVVVMLAEFGLLVGHSDTEVGSLGVGVLVQIHREGGDNLLRHVIETALITMDTEGLLAALLLVLEEYAEGTVTADDLVP